MPTLPCYCIYHVGILQSAVAKTKEDHGISESQIGGNRMENLEKKAGDVCIVALSGRLDAQSANDVEKKLDSLI